MMGDTAVAVNPNDERYQHLIGKTVYPAPHEPRDPHHCRRLLRDGLRHRLRQNDPGPRPERLRDRPARTICETIRVIDDHGKINENGGRYQGLDRYECRKAVLSDLEAKGYLVKTEPYHHNVGTCYRCHDDVEPLISAQWFVKMAPLAKEAIRVVKDGTIQFVPERFTKTYLNWMENVHDWCISRQLWWGHQIPAWTCADCGHITVDRQDPTCCAACGSTNITQGRGRPGYLVLLRPLALLDARLAGQSLPGPCLLVPDLRYGHGL